VILGLQMVSKITIKIFLNQLNNFEASAELDLIVNGFV